MWVRDPIYVGQQQCDWRARHRSEWAHIGRRRTRGRAARRSCGSGAGGPPPAAWSASPPYAVQRSRASDPVRSGARAAQAASRPLPLSPLPRSRTRLARAGEQAKSGRRRECPLAPPRPHPRCIRSASRAGLCRNCVFLSELCRD